MSIPIECLSRLGLVKEASSACSEAQLAQEQFHVMASSETLLSSSHVVSSLEAHAHGIPQLDLCHLMSHTPLRGSEVQDKLRIEFAFKGSSWACMLNKDKLSEVNSMALPPSSLSIPKSSTSPAYA